MVFKTPMRWVRSLRVLSLVGLLALVSACGSRMQTQTAPPVVAAPPPAPLPAPPPTPEPIPEPPPETAAEDTSVGRGRSVAPPPRPATPIAPDSDSVATGDASWYGDPYHGRATASGEIYDKNKLTAAHRTLPFDTWVRVENELNGRSVDVRINDRGPFVTGRIVDLSEAAAREIDMIEAGVVPVRLRVLRESADLETERPEQHVFYVVQVGAFREEARAHRLRRELEARYTGVYVEGPTVLSPLYKVRIGRALLSDAQSLQRMIRARDEIEAIVLEME